MTFADTLTRQSASHAAQPQEPTGGVPCTRDSDCSTASVGWAWTGEAWVASCGGHMPAHVACKIFDSEFLEDW